MRAGPTSAISFAKRLEPLGVAAQGIGSNLSAAGDDSGKTNTFAALMAAFDLDPAKGLTITGTGDKKPPKLDTIYFLTDGKPSVGVHVDTEDILREVKKINEVRGVVIHAISSSATAMSEAISKTPCPSSPSTRPMPSSSSWLAKVPGTSSPSLARWSMVRDVVKPTAPAAIASRTMSAICAMSSGVAASLRAPRSPIT